MEKCIDKTREINFISRMVLNSITPILYGSLISIISSFILRDFGERTILIILGVLIISSITGFYSIIYYLIEIKIIDDRIVINYMKFNKSICQSFPIKEIKVIKGRGLTNLGMGNMILIKRNFKTVFRQHHFYKWNRKRLNKIFDELVESGMKSTDLIKNSIFQ